MKPNNRKPLNLPHQVQARITDSQRLFIQTMAPNERNPAAQLRKTLERCINLALAAGVCSTEFYNHVAQYRPVRWEETNQQRPIPGREYLPPPFYARHNSAPQQQPTAQATTPVQHQAPAPQPDTANQDIQRMFGSVPAPSQPQPQPPAPAPIQPQQPSTAPQYIGNEYAHIPNSQRPPKYQATRQTRNATPDELAAEGRRVMDYATLEAQGKAPEWEHAAWEEVIPDDQV